MDTRGPTQLPSEPSEPLSRERLWTILVDHLGAHETEPGVLVADDGDAYTVVVDPDQWRDHVLAVDAHRAGDGPLVALRLLDEVIGSRDGHQDHVVHDGRGFRPATGRGLRLVRAPAARGVGQTSSSPG